jgi:dUTP pyrophosphatase
MNIRVKLDEGAKLPTKAHEADGGFDIYARRGFCVFGTKGNTIGTGTHDTGVHIEIPKGYVGLLKSKSGHNVKFGLTNEGVIDSGYTGSVVAKFYNHTPDDYWFKEGDKITQLVIVPIADAKLHEVDSLDSTERGDGGFGSSGR